MVRRYSRRAVVVGSGGVLVGLAGCASPYSGDQLVQEDFEDGLGEWERRAVVPDDPNVPGSPVAWQINQSSEQANTGRASAQFVLDGRQDDGTIWLVRPVTVARGRAYRVWGECVAWSESESFNTLAYLVMYTGQTPPADEESFPAPGENSSGSQRDTGGLREPLNQRAGWDQYSFTWETPPVDTDSLYVAVGVSVVWETEIQYFVDDVIVSLEPLPR